MHRKAWLAGCALTIAGWMIACGSSDSPSTQTTGGSGGGSAGQAGQTGQGGALGGNAGSAGSAGTSGQGGQAGGAGTAGTAGAGGAGGATDGGTTSFKRVVVDDAADGPAFVTAADMNGDGKLDLVVSEFGTISGLSLPNGRVRLFTQGANVETWTPSTILPSSAAYKFPNGTTIADVDGDTDLDIIIGLGFLACPAAMAGNCGALAWLENTGADWTVHEIVAKGSNLFYHHAEYVDFDGDNIKDLVTTGEEKPMFGSSKAVAQWFKGDATADRFDGTPNVIGDGLGSFPTVVDIDGDSDLDVISGEYFMPGGTFAWMERTSGVSFTRHVINPDTGPAILLALVPNLYGDGILHAVGSNHTNTGKTPPDSVAEAVFVFDLPADKTQTWPAKVISDGIQSRPGSMMAPQAAPGIFGTGDIDGDGDIDIALAGDGDERVFWLEQKGAGQFETHVLEAKLGQAGGLPVADLDADGRNEIVVTGYEDNKIYVYVRQ